MSRSGGRVGPSRKGSAKMSSVAPWRALAAGERSVEAGDDLARAVGQRAEGDGHPPGASEHRGGPARGDRAEGPFAQHDRRRLGDLGREHLGRVDERLGARSARGGAVVEHVGDGEQARPADGREADGVGGQQGGRRLGPHRGAGGGVGHGDGHVDPAGAGAHLGERGVGGSDRDDEGAAPGGLGRHRQGAGRTTRLRDGDDDVEGADPPGQRARRAGLHGQGRSRPRGGDEDVGDGRRASGGGHDDAARLDVTQPLETGLLGCAQGDAHLGAGTGQRAQGEAVVEGRDGVLVVEPGLVEHRCRGSAEPTGQVDEQDGHARLDRVAEPAGSGTAAR